MKKFTLLLTLPFFLNSPVLYSDPVDVEVSRYAQKHNLGVSKFVGTSKKLAKNVIDDTHTVLNQDFEFSQYFNLVKDGPVIEGRKNVGSWQKFGCQFVLGGDIRARGENRIEISAQVFDIASGKIVFKTKKKSQSGFNHRVVHEVANEVVEYFSGQKGIFTSYLAFVNDATGRKELYLSDYNGKSPRRITNDNSIVILPRIAPGGEKIIFTSYVSGNPDLYIINGDGTGRKKLSAKAGLNVSPSWAPNGQELALTLSINGPPNIYLMSTTGRIIRRLTDGKGADTAPAFSPDGTQIAFTSDRAGSPHIYVVNLDGTGLRRLTTEGHCDSAAWSPDGKNLVYVKGKAGSRFDIYSIEVLTGIERRLTWGEGDNENPAWSPDSRAILFTSTRRGKSELFTMLADGTNQKPLNKYKGQSFTPHWSS